jgi:hypothetical protein
MDTSGLPGIYKVLLNEMYRQNCEADPERSAKEVLYVKDGSYACIHADDFTNADFRAKLNGLLEQERSSKYFFVVEEEDRKYHVWSCERTEIYRQVSLLTTVTPTLTSTTSTSQGDDLGPSTIEDMD